MLAARAGWELVLLDSFLAEPQGQGGPHQHPLLLPHCGGECRQDGDITVTACSAGRGRGGKEQGWGQAWKKKKKKKTL